VVLEVIAVKRIEIPLGDNQVEDLKSAVGDVWDSWPRIDMIHRWSSRWHQNVDVTGGYEASTLLDNPLTEGKDTYLVVQVDGEHNAKLSIVQER
jgi:hypothetical protein